MPRELAYGSSLEEVLEEVKRKAGQVENLDAAKNEIANEYGFKTWRQLSTFIDIPSRDESEFEHLACLNYAWYDSPRRREKAKSMLSSDPALESRSIYSACVAGNVKQVETFLDEQPELLNQLGGYFDWEPLLYACYSRLELPNRSTGDVIRLLLERGADPNAHYRWGGIYWFSALTGIFGEGEQGPVKQPPHAECHSLARLLLDKGADCNDSQALYNRMFQPDNSTLELLLEYGLTKNHRCNWYATSNSKLIEHPEKTLDYQLQWAVKNDLEARVDILLANGADPSQELPIDGHLIKIARVNGFNSVADKLEKFGAEPYEMSAIESFLNACANANSDIAREWLEKDPDLVAKAEAHDPEAVNRFAEQGRTEAIRLMLRLGFNLQNPDSSTPLHHAAHQGHIELVKLLVNHNANHQQRDPFYLATPVVWALVGNKTEVVEYLSQLDIDLFDLIRLDEAERVEKRLNEDSGTLEIPLGDLVGESLKDHLDAWQTPLAFAALQGNKRIVELLVNHGADKNVQNSDGTLLTDLCTSEIRQVLE